MTWRSMRIEVTEVMQWHTFSIWMSFAKCLPCFLVGQPKAKLGSHCHDL